MFGRTLRNLAGGAPTHHGVAEQYRQTFVSTPVVIAVITLAVLVRSHRLDGDGAVWVYFYSESR